MLTKIQLMERHNRKHRGLIHRFGIPTPPGTAPQCYGKRIPNPLGYLPHDSYKRFGPRGGVGSFDIFTTLAFLTSAMPWLLRRKKTAPREINIELKKPTITSKVREPESSPPGNGPRYE